MSQEDLLLETNRLLQQLLDLDNRRREETERLMKENEARFEESKRKREEVMRSKLEERGVPSEIAELSEEAFQARAEEARRRMEANTEALKERDQRYREEVLGELRIQSDLLRQIAEKLGP